MRLFPRDRRDKSQLTNTNNDNAQIMMLRAVFLAGAALVLTLLLAYSALDAPAKISPQGCRMSYMSPSYVLLTGFNESWTSPSLASRYRLMLYREVGWDPQNEVCVV